MPPIILYDSPQITVRFYPDTKIVHHEMHGHAHGQDFNDALTAGAEAMKKYKGSKWLSDDRELPVLSPQDRQWGDDVWAPEVLKAGFKYWAIVQPAKALARIRLEERGQVWTKRGVTVEYFSDPDEALRWLKSQN